ncbi:39S ribosomal protein L53, mitochondrial [Schistocerca serialis cubense]|uniref:39S ribosomal protein L53, mitochondrial n=1 Tax=Schistocerca serialis cubense TaxID=2023355 RepID=UPI00214F07AF|nr:39S ribosomal protein L53, mitochondrial [Schistocerca serialis cubense]
MSIYNSGTFTRSSGLISAISKQLRSVTLKPVKKISVKFDPFQENVTETRNFLFHISSPKILSSNTSCVIKTDILCDRSEPNISFFLVNGESVIFKSKNLTALELLQLYNKHITPLAPAEQPASTVKTKSERKAAGRRQ